MAAGPLARNDRLEVRDAATYWIPKAMGIASLLFSLFLAVLWLAEDSFYVPQAVAAGFFGLWGLVALAHCQGITLDRAAGEAIQWEGLFVPLARKSFPLAHFDSVVVGFAGQPTRLSWRGLRYRPDVALTGPGRRLVLRCFTRGSAARDFGRQVAEFVGLELVDLLGDRRPTPRRGA